MASPQEGTSGSLVSPTAPTDAKDPTADTTGSNTTISNSGSKSGSAPSSVLVKPMDDGDPAPPEHKPDDNPDKKSWIALQLVYESNGLPVPGMAYQVTLPDGTTVANGSTDDQGYAKVDCIDPGSCQISFTDLDKEAWEDA